MSLVVPAPLGADRPAAARRRLFERSLQMKDSKKDDVAGARLESALVVRVREDVCEIAKDRRLYSVRSRIRE